MIFDFYAAISRLAVRFAHFLIGSSKRVYSSVSFFPFLNVVFVYNVHHLMSQMNMIKNNLTSLGLNPGQILNLVLGWVDCRVA